MLKVKKKISSIISNVIYFVILIFCATIAISIIGQRIFFPDKIPNIFGWKLFVVFDENMAEEIKSGDLVFTKMLDADKLELNDIIAYRNSGNYITIHKIISIDEEILQGNATRKFILQHPQREIYDKFIYEQSVEGRVEHIIPKLGGILYAFQKPIPLIMIYCFVSAIGSIWIYIAGKLDERNMQIINTEEAQKEKQKEEKEDSIKL